jgi:hypothetical protein
MSLPKPQFVANQLVELGTNVDYKKLSDVVFLLMRNKYPTPSDEELWDYIESYNDDIARELFRKENDSSIDGVDLNFDISDEDDNYYIKFYERPEINLLRSLQKDTPYKFEAFCKTILEKFGGKSSVTGGSHDGGVDFYAFDLKLNNLPAISTKGSRIVVIGQAKRYKDGNHVKEKDLREFIGASIKKIDEFKKTRPELMGIFQPVILAFWTTSDFA